MLRVRNSIVAARKDLADARSDEKWEKLVTEAKLFAQEIEIDLNLEAGQSVVSVLTSKSRGRPVRAQKMSTFLKEYYYNSTTGKRNIDEGSLHPGHPR